MALPSINKTTLQFVMSMNLDPRAAEVTQRMRGMLYGLEGDAKRFSKAQLDGIEKAVAAYEGLTKTEKLALGQAIQLQRELNLEQKKQLTNEVEILKIRQQRFEMEKRAAALRGSLLSTSDILNAPGPNVPRDPRAAYLAAERAVALERQRGMARNSGWQTIGQAATYGATLPLAGIATYAMSQQIARNQALTQVRSFLDPAAVSPNVMDTLDKQLQKMSVTPEVGETYKQLAEKMAYFEHRGVEAPRLAEYTKRLAFMQQVLPNESMDNIAGGLMKIMQENRLKPEQFGNLTSMLATLIRYGASSPNEVLRSMQYGGQTSEMLGIGIPQEAALLSVLTSHGIRAQVAGTGYQRIGTSMLRAVAEGGNQLTNYANVAGMSPDAFKKLFNEDSFKAIEKIGAGLQGLSKTQLVKVLDDLGLKEIRVQQGAETLAQGFGELQDRVEKVTKGWNDMNADQDVAITKSKSLERQLFQLKQQLDQSAATLGKDLMPAFSAVMNNGIIPMVEKIGELSEAFDKLSPNMKNSVIGLSVGAAAFGPTVQGIASLARAFTDLEESFASVPAMVTTLRALKSIGSFAVVITLSVIGAELLDKLLGLKGPVEAFGEVNKNIEINARRAAYESTDYSKATERIVSGHQALQFLNSQTRYNVSSRDASGRLAMVPNPGGVIALAGKYGIPTMQANPAAPSMTIPVPLDMLVHKLYPRIQSDIDKAALSTEDVRSDTKTNPSFSHDDAGPQHHARAVNTKKKPPPDTKSDKQDRQDAAAAKRAAMDAAKAGATDAASKLADIRSQINVDLSKYKDPDSDVTREHLMALFSQERDAAYALASAQYQYDVLHEPKTANAKLHAARLAADDHFIARRHALDLAYTARKARWDRSQKEKADSHEAHVVQNQRALSEFSAKEVGDLQYQLAGTADFGVRHSIMATINQRQREMANSYLVQADEAAFAATKEHITTPEQGVAWLKKHATDVKPEMYSLVTSALGNRNKALASAEKDRERGMSSLRTDMATNLTYGLRKGSSTSPWEANAAWNAAIQNARPAERPEIIKQAWSTFQAAARTPGSTITKSQLDIAHRNLLAQATDAQTIAELGSDSTRQTLHRTAVEFGKEFADQFGIALSDTLTTTGANALNLMIESTFSRHKANRGAAWTNLGHEALRGIEHSATNSLSNAAKHPIEVGLKHMVSEDNLRAAGRGMGQLASEAMKAMQKMGPNVGTTIGLAAIDAMMIATRSGKHRKGAIIGEILGGIAGGFIGHSLQGVEAGAAVGGAIGGAFASGGRAVPYRFHVMGEQGPELGMSDHALNVFTAHDSKGIMAELMRSGKKGGGPFAGFFNQINVNGNFNEASDHRQIARRQERRDQRQQFAR